MIIINKSKLDFENDADVVIHDDIANLAEEYAHRLIKLDEKLQKDII